MLICKIIAKCINIDEPFCSRNSDCAGRISVLLMQFSDWSTWYGGEMQMSSVRKSLLIHEVELDELINSLFYPRFATKQSFAILYFILFVKTPIERCKIQHYVMALMWWRILEKRGVAKKKVEVLGFRSALIYFSFFSPWSLLWLASQWFHAQQTMKGLSLKIENEFLFSFIFHFSPNSCTANA